MSLAVRRLRRLRYECRDWCTGVQGSPNPGTHLQRQTAQHCPEVWQ